MKYLRLYQIDESDFKDYNLLLAKLTSNIDDAFTGNVTNNNDMLCVKSVFHLLLEKLKKVNYVFRDKDIKYHNRIKNELKKLISEIELLEKLVSLYEEHANDLRLTTHLRMVLNQVKDPINNMSKNGLMTPNIESQFNNIGVVSNLVQEYVKVVYGKITLESYLQNYIRNQYFASKKIGVNEPCPCGSGKKYKKCCKR